MKKIHFDTLLIITEMIPGFPPAFAIVELISLSIHAVARLFLYNSIFPS